MTNHSTALNARAVFKRYGPVVALEGVSLAVLTGTVVALVGESGSGKTTLLRCFNGMVEVDSGSVDVAGASVVDADRVALRRSVGYVQQEAGLLPHWTIVRNAAMVPWLKGSAAEDFAHRWPRELSGGQRQRAALARALAGEPGILLLDEPFGALDAITRSDVQQTFGELRRKLDLTALLVTHDLREAFALADRVVVMREGGVEQEGPPQELRSAPASAYVAELVHKAGVQ